MMFEGRECESTVRSKDRMSDNEPKKGLRGVVTSYRRGQHKQHPNQVLLLFDGVRSRAEASSLIGRRVKWTSPVGREFLGKIVGPHGNSGVVRARFRTNLPGQAIGTPVVVV